MLVREQDIRFVSTSSINPLLRRTRPFFNRRSPLMTVIRDVLATFKELAASLLLI